jgi:hypothetical protein
MDYSFSLLPDCINNTRVYRTCPAEALAYWDGPGTVKYVHNTLKGDGYPPWIWSIEARDFGWKHAVEVGVVMDLLALYRDCEEVGGNLQQITVHDANWYFRSMFAVIRPFLDDQTLKKVRFV